MSEPVRLYHRGGQVIDCAAPSEVVRLLALGEWAREAWPEPAKPKPQVQPKADADGLPFATPLPRRQLKTARKPSGGGIL